MEQSSIITISSANVIGMEEGKKEFKLAAISKSRYGSRNGAGVNGRISGVREG
jgi:hypothetical protein